jgi:hypothetical protein
VLRCFVDWGIVLDTGQKGVYRQLAARPVIDKKLAAWLIEAVLISGNFKQILISAIAQNPSLFPFDLGMITPRDVGLNSRLELFRQGTEEDVIMLKE